MKYYGFGTYTGKENMKIDSDLLEESIEKDVSEPIFRLYAWYPKCVSLGRNQKRHFQHGSRKPLLDPKRKGSCKPSRTAKFQTLRGTHRQP